MMHKHTISGYLELSVEVATCLVPELFGKNNQAIDNDHTVFVVSFALPDCKPDVLPGLIVITLVPCKPP